MPANNALEEAPVADAHLHVNPIKGLGARVVARMMRESGAWFAAMVTLPHWSYGVELRGLEDYLRVLELHKRECRLAREEGLVVSCFAGFHPAELDALIDRGMGHQRAYELGLAIVRTLFRECQEEAIDGVGEVGRQHYTIRPDKLLVAQRLMVDVLEMAKDYGCRVQLHLENLRGFTAWDLSSLLRRLGVRPELVLVHYARPGVLEELHSQGLFASAPAVPEGVREAFARANLDLLLLESDYLDEGKAGTRLGPWDLRRLEERLVKEGLVTVEALHRVNVDNVERFFGVRY